MALNTDVELIEAFARSQISVNPPLGENQRNHLNGRPTYCHFTGSGSTEALR